ncbi:creatininase family protein [Heliobacterium chlorum]|uniref:Creatininase family protein n=1 Tax=Heliobacterium chlorum TaxID=2698 RepID=A0ABR7T4I9_HELCL|nr:creatininase family protein [Heliobacterium chlorum]MBC9784764.1 creatininase family protein [Heliobacterium chlorum]
MKIYDMAWTEIANIDFSRSILFIPIAPVEEHGPHLPTGVDCLTAEEACRRCDASLEELTGLKPFVFPLIPLGSAPETADFPGTISLPEKLLTSLVQQTLLQASRWGFRYCVVVSPHGSPSHLASIHAAIRSAEAQGTIQGAEPFARWIYSRPTKNGSIPDIHAGQYETSLMLALHPQLVKTTLLPNLLPCSIRDMRGPGTWKSKGALDGYLGSPAEATFELGEKALPFFHLWIEAAKELHKGIRNNLPPFLEAKVQMILSEM